MIVGVEIDEPIPVKVTPRHTPTDACSRDAPLAGDVDKGDAGPRGGLTRGGVAIHHPQPGAPHNEENETWTPSHSQPRGRAGAG